MPDQSFIYGSFGNTGMSVHRLGLSATHRPGKKTIYKAIDEGVNFFFCYGFDTHMTKALREAFKTRREKLIVATGAYNLLVWHPDIRRTFEKRLRQLGTDYIDVFLFLGVMKPQQFTPRALETMQKLKDEGKVRCIGISCHDRKFLGQLAEAGDINALMMRYNAAHRGAEEDIFPHLAKHNPGVISYTATRWGYLLRRPRNYPKDAPLPTAGQCYRFVLQNPHVDVCLTAPSNEKQLMENLKALDDGPLSPEENEFIKKFGDMIHYKMGFPEK